MWIHIASGLRGIPDRLGRLVPISLIASPVLAVATSITLAVVDDWHLMMPLYVCRKWQGTPVAKEHSALKWVRPQKLHDYPMPPADIPLIAPLCDLL